VRSQDLPAAAAHVPPAAAASYPVRAGNAVRPLIDGEPAFRRICEAVEGAQRSVWVTVAFLQRDVRMPDGRGSVFDVLDAAASRGLDVRVIFWRSAEQEREKPGIHFFGDAEQRRWLEARGSRFLARWDALPRTLCHHQKSWLLDAGHPGETAFVGGINLGDASISPPGHPERTCGDIHDLYVEVRGPCASDVHHNFVQRWNETSERDREDGVWPPGQGSEADLPFPEKPSPRAGSVPAQITRTVREKTYTRGVAAPEAEPFDVAAGETSVLEQYVAAIEAARRSIYVEDQAIGSPIIVERLHEALARGVEVAFLVPYHAHPEFVRARRNPRYAAWFERLHELAHRERFLLAGIASNRPGGGYHDVYVHAKIMLVDDVWATIGSTNVADRSFRGDTELNASFWCRETVRALRVELLREHLASDTRDLDDVAALRRYREVADRNAAARRRGQALHGLAFRIDPRVYGIELPDQDIEEFV